MQKTTTYCDICGEVAKSSYKVEIKWWSDAGYHSYDICEECKNQAEIPTFVKIRPYQQNQDTFLGLLKNIFKKIKA